MTAAGAPNRVLLVRPSALGDVCRTVPVLVSLRRAFPRPGTRIDWVVQEEYAAAIAAHPDLDGVVPFPRRRFTGWWRRPAAAAQVRHWFRELRKREYDLVFDCQGLSRSGLIAWATRAPRRVGFRSARELGWLGCNVRHEVPAGPHTVDEMLSLLAGEGIEPVRDMRLYAAADDRDWWERESAARGMTGERFAVLAPTSRWASKRWPVERWGALVAPLVARGYGRVVVIGAPGEREQVAPLLEDSTAGGSLIDLVGCASIGRTMAVIESAALVVANDSAPLHMAVGLGVPCVGLYGPTDPERVGPYRQPEAVVRSSAAGPAVGMNFKDRRLGDAVMRLISVKDVLARIDQIAGMVRLNGEAATGPEVVVARGRKERAGDSGR